VKQPHVHCYDEFPGEVKWCQSGWKAPVLGPDDEVVIEGEVFKPLLTLVGNCLDVKRDWRGAQIAVKYRPEPSLTELSELVGAGTSTA
jgi:hypothetical protein